MKTAPIMADMACHPDTFQQVLVHTGQHYDANMSDIFFDDLGLPAPHYHLGVGSGSHGQQTARVMMAFEPVVEQEKPDLVLVVGDVNSTIACALVSAKLGIPVGHIEAGLRSFDRTMPEEINRILTDQLADLLFTPSPDADENLHNEGIGTDKIYRVGNVMIDTLIRLLPRAEARWPLMREVLSLNKLILVTLHRPANVDEPKRLKGIIEALAALSTEVPVIFPVHPRTRQRLVDEHSDSCNSRLQYIEPLGYLDFLALERHASLVITDSGGVQEETTYLGVPCLTVRPNTERPITVSQGTNRLVTADTESLVDAARSALHTPTNAHGNGYRAPDLWDGKAAYRIVENILNWKHQQKG